MKKLTLIAAVLACCVFLNGFICVAPVSESNAHVNNNLVVTARLENLLNQNTVYDDDFYSNQNLVNAATIVLKGYADEDGFIKNEIVSAYIKDMYDINIDLTKGINPDLPQKEGYVLLVPRGYSVYSHKITNIENIGNQLIVTSFVRISTHDGQEFNKQAETIFIENENSIFGYSILNSQLTEQNLGLKI